MIIRNGLDDRSAVGSGVLQVSFKGAVHMAWQNKCGPFEKLVTQARQPS